MPQPLDRCPPLPLRLPTLPPRPRRWRRRQTRSRHPPRIHPPPIPASAAIATTPSPSTSPNRSTSSACSATNAKSNSSTSPPAHPTTTPTCNAPHSTPPSDGYQPPEDPLLGCIRPGRRPSARQKKPSPDIPIVGTAYTYFQDYLPHVAQAVVRQGWTDFVGLGRMVLSYWEMPADTLAGRPMATKRICRTFSDCTTGPRNGLISGCYPLDPHYKQAPEARQLKQIKSDLRTTQRESSGPTPG